jgi:hypothetical protein
VGGWQTGRLSETRDDHLPLTLTSKGPRHGPPSEPAPPYWQDKLFISLARNADDASSYFRLPTDRVVEVGSQITV